LESILVAEILIETASMVAFNSGDEFAVKKRSDWSGSRDDTPRGQSCRTWLA
jgi:hypothetical protein